MRKDLEKLKEQDISREIDVLKALSNEVRYRIVSSLCMNGCCVKELHECLELPQSTVSQHINLLKNLGILKGKRNKTRTFYYVSDEFTKQLVAFINKCKL